MDNQLRWRIARTLHRVRCGDRSLRSADRSHVCTQASPCPRTGEAGTPSGTTVSCRSERIAIALLCIGLSCHAVKAVRDDQHPRGGRCLRDGVKRSPCSAASRRHLCSVRGQTMTEIRLPTVRNKPCTECSSDWRSILPYISAEKLSSRDCLRDCLRDCAIAYLVDRPRLPIGLDR